MNPLQEKWENQWEEALGLWSHLVMMRPPHWCYTKEELKEEGLESSFAMIRLKDHRIVLDATLIKDYGLEDFPLEIMAHEIGHHVYIPANLQDNGRLFSLVRKALVSRESYSPLIINLFADQLINYRLQNQNGLAMVQVYKKILAKQKGENSSVWNLYLAIYEKLFSLKSGELAQIPHDLLKAETLEEDSEIGAHIIRSYSQDWLEGAYAYALLFYPGLWEYDHKDKIMLTILDTLKASEGASGQGADLEEVSVEDSGLKNGHPEIKPGRTTPTDVGEWGKGPGQRYKSPKDYLDYMRQLDPGYFDKNTALIQYYRQIASPYLIPFPMEKSPRMEQDLPEGLELWDLGDNPGEIDWFGTIINNPKVIPGMTTVKRTYGLDEDSTLQEGPLDLYIGIDCSGSMNNPAMNFSWPVLAGTIIAQSALRAGAKVKVVLSGEPGSYLETTGFIADQKKIMNVLVSYLGTGFAFGIPRLSDDFSQLRNKKTHILLLTDDDIFAMLGGKRYGNNDPTWDIASRAIKNCQGGGSLVLYSRPEYHMEEAERLKKEGWNIYYVANDEELSLFAKNFARTKYGRLT